VFNNGFFEEPLLNGYAIFFVRHLLSRIIHLTIRSSQSNDPKLKIQKLKSHELPTSFHLFLYIKKKDEREIERERREKEEIKTEIRPSQFQTAIIFDKKLRLRRATWLQKS
jgi:hypothetical protein